MSDEQQQQQQQPQDINPNQGIKPSRADRRKAEAAAAAIEQQQTAVDDDDTIDDDGTDDDEQQQQQQQHDDDKGDDTDDDKEGDSHKQQTLLFKEVAEKLGIDGKDLYELQVPMGDNKFMTLGEIKDAYKHFAPAFERMENLDRQENDARAERATMLRELDNLVSVLPREALTPQFQAIAREKLSIISRQETQKLLQMFPEWSNPIAFEASMTGMVNAAAKYGLTGRDIGSIVDARLIHALHDLSTYQQREAAAASLKSKPPKSQKAGKTPAKHQKPSNGGRNSDGYRSARKEKHSSKESQADRVAKLLSGNR